MEANKFDLSLPAFFIRSVTNGGERAKLYVLYYHTDECSPAIILRKRVLSRRLPVYAIGMQVIKTYKEYYLLESSFSIRVDSLHAIESILYQKRMEQRKGYRKVLQSLEEEDKTAAAAIKQLEQLKVTGEAPEKMGEEVVVPLTEMNVFIQRSSPQAAAYQEIGNREMVQHLSNVFIGLYQQAGNNTIYLTGFISEIPETAKEFKLYALPSTNMYSVIDMNTKYITHTTIYVELTENTYAMFSQTTNH